MKKLILKLIVSFTITALFADAAPRPNPMDVDKDGRVSKEEFFDARKKFNESKGAEFKQSAVEEMFNKKDMDKDGFLAAAELYPNQKK